MSQTSQAKEYLKKQMPTLDITIDLETCALCPTAAVMSVGAVAWDRNADNAPFQVCVPYTETSYYKHVDLRSSFVDGFTFDQSTAQWWAVQDDAVKSTIYAYDETPLAPIEDVILGLCAFIEDTKKAVGAKDVHLWSQGTDFDIAILRNICGKYNIELPIKHQNFRDHRTFYMEGAKLICDTTGTEFNAQKSYTLVDEYDGRGHLHDPIYDCKRSIYSTWQMMKHLRCLNLDKP